MTKDEFLEKMVLFFPDIKDEIEKQQSTYGEILYTSIIEDSIMPHILGLLEDDEVEALKEVFDFFEVVSKEADQELFNCFSTTVLEILGNDRKILEKAKKYMGQLTAKYQKEADLDLGRKA